MTAMDLECELDATLCKFEPATLKWVPEEEASASVHVRLVKASTGDYKLQMDKKEVPLAELRFVAPLSAGFLALHVGPWGHIGLKCGDEEKMKSFVKEVNLRKNNYERFEQYEQGSVQSYFQYYAKLANQQNMLQDAVRTSIYRRAIVENPDDFKGQVAMDIGAGSGILSFFAAQAGASTVYAVEASSMGEVVRLLADTNTQNLGGADIVVINKPLENIKDDEIKGKVDVLVSEPIGTFLFNERMIETYLCARDRFLKPGGKMFPNVGNLCIAPFSDATLNWEQQNKNSFWKNNSFYGLDLSAAVGRCTNEHMRQPIVDYINPEFLVGKTITKKFDFQTCTVESLQNIEIPFDFEIHAPVLVHGIAGWFDAIFEGSNQTIVLSTAPWCPGTHWYQIRFLLETPLAVNAGQHLVGTLKMDANNLQSYYMKLDVRIKGTDITSKADCIDLKDPEYRFYSSPNAYCPPGTVSPTQPQPAAQPVAQAQPQQADVNSVQYQQLQAYCQQQLQQAQQQALAQQAQQGDHCQNGYTDPSTVQVSASVAAAAGTEQPSRKRSKAQL